MPLRYVPVPPILLDCPEKMGNRMPLERAMAVMMLDPSTRYMPIDIARLGYQYAWGLDKDEINRRVANARRSYAEIARLGLNRSNPNLTGIEWMALLKGNLHAVAAKMEELRLLMLAQPGVLFTIVGEQLVPHPDQSLDPNPLTPLKRSSPDSASKRATQSDSAEQVNK